MYAAQISGDLGFNPLKKIKKGVRAAAKGAKKGVKAAAKGAKKVVKKVASVAEIVSSSAWRAAAAPVRAQLNILVARRARKIAWDRRRSKRPTRAEQNEARTWTRNVFRAKGAKGKFIATLLLGAPEATLLGDFGLSPLWLLTPAAPVALIIMIKDAMRSSSKEAPEKDPSEEPPAPEEIPEEPPPEEQSYEEEPAPEETPEETPEEPPPEDEGETSGAGDPSPSMAGYWAALGSGLVATALGAWLAVRR